MLMAAIRLIGAVPIVVICLYRLVMLALNARSWQLLLPEAERPRFSTLLRLRWIGESVNNLLPVAQVGGDAARAWLVSARGVPRSQAVASAIVDLGMGIMTQAVFGIVAFAALAQIHLLNRAPPGLSPGIVLGLAMMGLTALTVFVLLRFGATRVVARLFTGKRARHHWVKLADGLNHLDDAVRALLARERVLASSFGWHLLAWLSQVGETWFLLATFGHPVSLRAALAIEGVTAAVRGASFFVPGSLGVQEVAIVSTARLAAGVNVETALALGLAKRARELLVGIPGLIAWALEKPWWWKRARGKGRGSDE
jgi:putative membrane protein